MQNGLPNGDVIPQAIPDQQSEQESSADNTGTRIRYGQIRTFTTAFWLLSIYCLVVYATTVSFTGIASGLLLEQYLFVEPAHDCVLKVPGDCSSGYLASSNQSKDDSGACAIESINAPAIPDSLNVTSGDPSWDKSSYVFPDLKSSDIDCTDEFWSAACTEDYCEMQEKATQQAGVLMAIPFITTVLTISFFGYYGVDIAGMRAEMVALAPFLLVVSHGMLAFWQNPSIVPLPLVLMGLGYSMAVAALWPSIPLTIQRDSIGTAFGLMTCIQALGNSIFPLIVAAIYNHTGKRYAPGVEIFFMVCTGAVVLVGSRLLALDRKRVSSC
jgi:hypothetical protein